MATRGGMKTQVQRDEEWRLLVRSITDPDGASEDDEARFRAYLDELGPRSPHRVLPSPGSPDEVDSLGLGRQGR